MPACGFAADANLVRQNAQRRRIFPQIMHGGHAVADAMVHGAALRGQPIFHRYAHRASGDSVFRMPRIGIRQPEAPGPAMQKHHAGPRFPACRARQQQGNLLAVKGWEIDTIHRYFPPMHRYFPPMVISKGCSHPGIGCIPLMADWKSGGAPGSPAFFLCLRTAYSMPAAWRRSGQPVILFSVTNSVIWR